MNYKFVDFALFSITNFFNQKVKASVYNESIEKIRTSLSTHLNEIITWSNELEFIGLGQPLSADNTIKLDYYFSLSLDNRKIHDSPISEEELLQQKYNCLILGDPGSGKSTTLKRIILKTFLKNESQSSFNFPLLIRFRYIEPDYDFFTYICKILSLDYEIRYEVTVRKNENENQNVILTLDELNKKKSVLPEGKAINVIRTLKFVEGTEISIFISDLLNSNKILLVLDGFDEINSDLREIIYSQINQLSLRIGNAKILMTSRPNYIRGQFNNFVTVFINELLPEQIIAITRIWISEYLLFIKELENKSYKELANRPLFLSFLILLYKEGELGVQKNLPKSSQDVYEQILELLIYKWDKKRDIIRISKYGKYFSGKRKIEFLSHLSFNLTYHIKRKSFTHDDLLCAYLQINQLYDLPEDEADIVATEIENHTGIIVKSYYNQYEFSHLAIQEFLCASNIVRAPIEENITLYLSEYPEPLALVICLSTAPDSLFYMIVDNAIRKLEKERATEIFKIIISRLVTENPKFSITNKLGITLLLIAEHCNRADKDFITLYELLLKSNYRVLESIKLVLAEYYTFNFIDNINNAIIFLRTNPSSEKYFPYKVFIPLSTKEYINI